MCSEDGIGGVRAAAEGVVKAALAEEGGEEDEGGSDEPSCQCEMTNDEW